MPSRTYELQGKCNSPMSAYSASLNHAITTAWVAPWISATYREHQCASLQPILHLFLVTSGAVRSRVRLLVAQKHAHKARAPRTTYLSDFPAPLNHSTATVRIVPRAERTDKNVQKDAHFCRICLFLVTSSTVHSRVSPDVVRQHAHKARPPRTTYLSDDPAPLDYSIAFGSHHCPPHFTESNSVRRMCAFS